MRYLTANYFHTLLLDFVCFDCHSVSADVIGCRVRHHLFGHSADCLSNRVERLHANCIVNCRGHLIFRCLVVIDKTLNESFFWFLFNSVKLHTFYIIIFIAALSDCVTVGRCPIVCSIHFQSNIV